MPKSKKILIIAHRGSTYTGYPENSLPAFQMAVDEGFDGVEMDVRLTKDKELVVFHDIRLERLTDTGRGMVRTKALQQLKHFRLKNDRVETFIPLLSEALEILKNTPLLINIEIKSEMPMRGKIEQRVIDMIYRYGVQTRVVISSFNPLVIKKTQKVDPTIRTGFIFEKRLPKFNQRLATGLIVTSWHPQFKGISPLTLQRAHSNGCAVYAWTVNDEKDIIHLLDFDIDGIITDRPDIVRRVIADKSKKN